MNFMYSDKFNEKGLKEWFESRVKHSHILVIDSGDCNAYSNACHTGEKYVPYENMIMSVELYLNGSEIDYLWFIFDKEQGIVEWYTCLDNGYGVEIENEGEFDHMNDVKDLLMKFESRKHLTL